MGRIGHYADHSYEVNLPGYRAKYVAEPNIYTRCRLPLEDPTEVLVLKAHETPFFLQRRLDFYKALLVKAFDPAVLAAVKSLETTLDRLNQCSANAQQVN